MIENRPPELLWFPTFMNLGEEYADDNTDSGRTALRWQGSESFTLDWTADATRSRERAADVGLIGLQHTAALDHRLQGKRHLGLQRLRRLATAHLHPADEP